MNWAFLPFKRYADFSGRSRRKEYWSFNLMYSIVYSIFVFVIYGLDPDFENGLTMVFSFLFLIFALGSLIPALAVFVRRMHDTGRSGWYYFMSLIPFVGSVILFIYTIEDSQRGENQYGPNPKEENNPGLQTNF